MHSCVHRLSRHLRNGKVKLDRLASIPDFGNRRKIFRTDSSPQEITRDGIIFPYQRDMVHDARARARDTHVREMRRWLFSIWKENICLCTQLTADRLTVREIRTPLSISDWLYIRQSEGGGRQGRHPVTRQTSDGSGINGEYWLEILEILKRSRARPDVSRASRDWNLTLPYYPNRTKGTFDEIWNIRVIPLFAPPPLKPVLGKKCTTEYTLGIYSENLIKDPG